MVRRSPHRPPSASHPPERAAALRKAYRYGVPRAMIERATELRLAGDWRGACAAADVDVRLDVGEARDRYGTEFADALLDDLRHLVPELARLHMPRFLRGRGTLVPQQPVLLSRPGGGEGPYLMLAAADFRVLGTQGLALELWDDDPRTARIYHQNRVKHLEYWDFFPHVWETSRHLWDSRHVHEARERWGGSTERAPFLNPDGTPRTTDELPTADPGPADPAARTEWIDHLHQTGRVAEALTAAGIDLDTTVLHIEGMEPVVPERALARIAFSPALLAGEVRRLAGLGYGSSYGLPVNGSHRLVAELRDDGALGLRFEEFRWWAPASSPAPLPESAWTRSPDIDVLRDGSVTPDELHPLVREALAPARPPADGPAGPPPWTPSGPVRVRCRGEWHRVESRGGRLTVLSHDEDDERREEALMALGGAPSGCFAAREAWVGGKGRLPRGLRAQRDDLFERVRHGDTEAVLAYLDAGGDPRVRDRRERGLLHHLNSIDHRRVMPRLLDAGVDVDVEDRNGQTPLFLLTLTGGTPDMARALIDAGAALEGVIQDYDPSQKEYFDEALHSAAADLDDGWDELLEEIEELAEE